jgi:hypothetical protein
MAVVTRFVNTASATAGGNGTTNALTGANRAYKSLDEWEAAESTDLVTAGDSHIVICGGGVDDAGTSGVSIDSWVTSATYDLTIKCTTDKHDGRSRDVSGSGYQLTASSTGFATLRLDTKHVTVDGLEIKSTVSGVLALAVLKYTSLSSGDNQVDVLNSIVHGNSASSSNYVIEAKRSNSSVLFDNIIAYSGMRIIDTRGSSNTKIRKATFWRHANQLGIVASSELTCRNTYVGQSTGSAQDFWTGGSSPSGNNNASSDSTATTDYPTDSLVSKAGADQFVSVTAGSEDFNLTSTSDLIDEGATVGLAFDIIGTTRTAPYDIGAFKFVSGGGGTTVVMSISESIAAADTSTGRLSAVLSVSESAGASDIDQGQYATSQEIIEAVQANDLTTSLFKGLLTQSLSALASDAVSFTTPGIILTIGETVTSSDSLSISAHFKMTIGESANLTDSASSRASLISSISESISGSDRFNRSSAFSLTISESVIATDLMSALNPNLLGQITATISIDALIGGTINLIPTITGTIKVN